MKNQCGHSLRYKSRGAHCLLPEGHAGPHEFDGVGLSRLMNHLLEERKKVQNEQRDIEDLIFHVALARATQERRP